MPEDSSRLDRIERFLEMLAEGHVMLVQRVNTLTDNVNTMSHNMNALIAVVDDLVHWRGQQEKGIQ